MDNTFFFFKNWLKKSFYVCIFLWIMVILILPLIFKNEIFYDIGLVLTGIACIYFQRLYAVIMFKYIDLSNVDIDDIVKYIGDSLWYRNSTALLALILFLWHGISFNHASLILIGCLVGGLSTTIGLTLWRLATIGLYVASFFYFSWFIYAPALVLTFLSLRPFFVVNPHMLNK